MVLVWVFLRNDTHLTGCYKIEGIGLRTKMFSEVKPFIIEIHDPFFEFKLEKVGANIPASLRKCDLIKACAKGGAEDGGIGMTPWFRGLR